MTCNRPRRKGTWYRVGFHMTGLLALLWFLIRVVPKPSRASYPCQRAALPYASAFVVWLMSGLGTISLFRKARCCVRRSRYIVAGGCVVLGVSCVWIAMTVTSNRRALANSASPNEPMGRARGVFPGRVVWIHDPEATRWAGRSYPWDPLYTNQSHVDAMVAKAVRLLAGESEDSRAWDVMFKHFNREHKRGSAGYTAGEKIAIKVNMTTCGRRHGAVNPLSYEKRKLLDKSDTSPQLILAVLRQLVHQAHVDPNDIAVGDTLCLFPNQWWRICHGEFPQVTYFDAVGQRGRVKSVPSGVAQHWSQLPIPGDPQTDYIPKVFAEADYIINIAVLKSHATGVSLCAKNHYGSYNRTPDDARFFNLHKSLAWYETRSKQYRALVDVMGHPDLGGKTLLSVIDALYGGYRWQGTARRFKSAPFDDDWPSSVLVSLDPVAIDSVGLDILWQEWPEVVGIDGVDDYLHEAALADDPPSRTFYDPDADGTSLESLGVHEHWNDPSDRQYSRNLGTGNGIELLYIKGDASSK